MSHLNVKLGALQKFLLISNPHVLFIIAGTFRQSLQSSGSINKLPLRFAHFVAPLRPLRRCLTTTSAAALKMASKPQWTAPKVRDTFIDYFKERGHKFVPSSSVVPLSDPTLLFTVSGRPIYIMIRSLIRNRMQA